MNRMPIDTDLALCVMCGRVPFHAHSIIGSIDVYGLPGRPFEVSLGDIDMTPDEADRCAESLREAAQFVRLNSTDFRG